MVEKTLRVKFSEIEEKFYNDNKIILDSMLDKFSVAVSIEILEKVTVLNPRVIKPMVEMLKKKLL